MAHVFCRSLARLLNRSVVTSTIPKQWKMATITPVPKIATPWECVDFQPVFVTPVLIRVLERVTVREFIYPALLVVLEPPARLSCTDPDAFRPTGSTTAAVSAILQSITELLSCNTYVVVIALESGLYKSL